MAWLEGMNEVLRNLNKEIKNIEGRTESGMIRAAIQVRRDMEKTPPIIPVDTSNLRASWFIITRSGRGATSTPTFSNVSKTTGERRSVDTQQMRAQHERVTQNASSEVKQYKYPVLIMGFSASYATEVHEDMTKKRKRPGSGPKFLEQSLIRNRSYILKVIREEARIK